MSSVSFRCERIGRVVRRDDVHCSVLHLPPESVHILLRAERGIALGPTSLLAKGVRGEEQVLKAGLTRGPHSLRSIELDEVEGAGERAVHHVEVRSGPIGQFEQAARGLRLGYRRTAQRVIDGRRVAPGLKRLGLGEDDLLILLMSGHGATGRCNLLEGLVQAAVRDAGEADRGHFDRGILEPHGTRPGHLRDHAQVALRGQRGIESDVDERLGADVGHLRLEPLQRIHRSGRLVERHVDDGGGPTRRRRTSGGGDSLVYAGARMYMCVHEAREDQVTRGLDHLGTAERRLGDHGDLPSRNSQPPAYEHSAVRKGDVAVDDEIVGIRGGVGH